MSKLTVTLLAAVMLLTVGGCFESKMVLLVQKDGSGTIEHTMYIANMPNLGPMPGGDGVKPEDAAAAGPKMTKEQAEEAAKAMGEGVTVKSFEALPDRDGRKGWKTVYAVADVTKIKLSPMPSMGPMSAGGAERPLVSFEFAKGDSPKLTAVMPPMKAPKGPPQAGPDADPAQQEMALQMMKLVLKDMRVQLIVKVDSAIKKTNASYVNKKRDGIWLYYQDMGGLVNDDAAMKKMMEATKVKDVEKIKEALKDKDLGKYIMIDTHEKVEIEFE